MSSVERTYRFSDADLTQIVEEAAIYMCACPGQVASELRQLRDLIHYQQRCIHSGETSVRVHEIIEAASWQAHAHMEACLEDVLALEGWDRATLRMPEGLRQLRDELIDKGL